MSRVASAREIEVVDRISPRKCMTPPQSLASFLSSTISLSSILSVQPSLNSKSPCLTSLYQHISAQHFLCSALSVLTSLFSVLSVHQSLRPTCLCPASLYQLTASSSHCPMINPMSLCFGCTLSCPLEACEAWKTKCHILWFKYISWPRKPPYQSFCLPS